MKRILTILFILVTACAYGQRITDNNTRVGFLELRANGWFHLPEDTVLSPSINANPCQQVAKKNGTVYTYDCILHKWVPIVSNATVVDSGRVSNDTLYLHKNTGGEIAIKLGYYTTSQADARFLQKIDTASLSNRINAKVNISDTANMLSKYLRKGDTASLSNRINLMIPLSQKAANNGVAPLGSDGKVPAAYLPSGAQVYKGTWDASTNTPTLVDGTGTAGWTYRVTVGGTQNLGSGNITFAAGDDVIYNGTIWQRNPNGATVTSVNGQQGAVVLTTDNVAEGSTNKYFTTARVNAAETDPTVPANVKAITATNISNWNTAFGWGNHASAGYLTTATGDARYPLLSGSYSNPSWLASLPWSKITGAPAFITGNQTITLTGDITGTGATAITTTLRNIGTAGTYTKVTTDAQGRITAGAGIDTADIPSFSKKVRPLLSGTGPITFGSTTGVIGWNGTTTNVPEGTNLYWTTARGDARYPLLSGSYANPSWLASLPWSKITGTPTTLAGYGITDAAPGSGSGSYVQNQITSAQSGAGFWTAGIGIANSGFQSNATLGAAHQNFNTPAGIRRFTITLGTAETGSNVGSDFAINRHNDAGTLIGSALVISRATGLVQAVSGYRGATGSGVYRSGANSLLYFYDTDNATRLGYTGDVNGDAYLVSDNGNVNLRPGAANTSFTLTPTTLNLSTGLLNLTNSSSNLINFAGTSLGAPTFNTQSLGTKQVWYGTSVTASSVQYASGMESGHSWNSVPTAIAGSGFKWYGGVTEVSRLDGIGSQQWAGQGRFKGWINNTWATGIGAEVGTTGGIATFAGVDRSASPAAYAPVQIIGGTGTPTGNIFTINGSGYTFSSLPNISSLGTDATGKLINTTANFIQNQTSAAQSGVGFWTAGAGIANRFAAYGPVASTNGDIGLYEGTSAAGANQRWRFLRSTAEAAGNVGNNLLIQAMDNTGNSLFNALSITRSTGVVTTPQGIITPKISAPATNDMLFDVDAGENYRYRIGGTEKVTISSDGILAVGNTTPSTARSAPLQVQGNIWSTDAYILGTSNVPTGEFGIGGSDVFVRTMSTNSVLLQTNSTTTVAKANGATSNFEVTNQIKIGGGTPGTGKFLMSSDGAGTAVWSSGDVKSVRVITTNYTAVADDNTIINRATTGTPVVTLPAASSNTGRVYTIVEEAANATANGVVFSAVLFRGTTYTSFNNPVLSGKSRITIQSDGSNWVIIGGM